MRSHRRTLLARLALAAGACPEPPDTKDGDTDAGASVDTDPPLGDQAVSAP